MSLLTTIENTVESGTASPRAWMQTTFLLLLVVFAGVGLAVLFAPFLPAFVPLVVFVVFGALGVFLVGSALRIGVNFIRSRR